MEKSRKANHNFRLALFSIRWIRFRSVSRSVTFTASTFSKVLPCTTHSSKLERPRWRPMIGSLSQVEFEFEFENLNLCVFKGTLHRKWLLIRSENSRGWATLRKVGKETVKETRDSPKIILWMKMTPNQTAAKMFIVMLNLFTKFLISSFV